MKKLAKYISTVSVAQKQTKQSKGGENNMRNEKFENICRFNQKVLKVAMHTRLKAIYDEVISDDGFLFAKGEVPICLVAHMDTVHEKESTPKTFCYKGGNVSSPQGIGGDDRCGIYMIMEIIKKHKCSVLFLEDEECGGIGAGKFVRHEASEGLEFNYMIELDRRGSKDAVFYDCGNDEFEDFITEDGDWKTAFGSYSDISDIAPSLGCAAVNLSCGYYNAHTKSEYVVLAEMEDNIKKVCKLIERTTEEDKFEYIEKPRARYNYGGYNWSNYYGDYYEDNYYGGYYGGKTSSETEMVEEPYFYYMIIFIDENGEEDFADCSARSRHEALGIFLEDHPTLCYGDIIGIENFGVDHYML